ncbi:primase C-terminal domain-containing protein [Fructilactobacillus cliffordii]|uniref:Primase C-terminal domain-containing protein n=1 Tax=Fructilactobacillus cliffordii TaxID=2940299 RepID=A0A9Q8ZVF9_9LACO|nr:primase C-terminal domain-containing protein [Fructilactobacillus cliffordii]USS89987.1 primase C-terminal domain-containing protein [Fructilactobacillus cliffordii]
MAELTKNELHTALKCVLHQGLTNFKVRNSKKVLHLFQEQDLKNKKGSIALFRSKPQMKKSQGFPVTSFEALFENDNKATHWTPNEFSWLGYTDDKKGLKGHFEKNLIQINTFVVDIDFKSAQERDINRQKVFDGLLLGYVFLPTLILITDKGYQVYYVLKDPAFVAKKNNEYPVLKAAKLIAKNIKRAIKHELGEEVDVGCNDFGIFRVPRQDNVLYFEPEMQVNFYELIRWSEKYQDDERPKLEVVHSKLPKKQMDQPWFNWLLHKKNIKPGMGLGRHNTILTLALACYSSDLPEEDAYNLLDEFNSNLYVSLDQRDFSNCIKSAYSGKYKGANRLYINTLIETWATSEEAAQIRKQKKPVWHKYAKKRSERKYSHKKEWAQDLLKVLDRIGSNLGSKSVSMSTRELQKELGISPSSLNRVLKELKRTNKIIVKKTSNNQRANSYTTLKMLLRALINSKVQLHKQFLNQAVIELESDISELKNTIESLTANKSKKPGGFARGSDLSTKNLG